MVALRVKMMAWRVNEKLNLKWIYFKKIKKLSPFKTEKVVCVRFLKIYIYLVEINYQNCIYK
jgi:hypothetical protein